MGNNLALRTLKSRQIFLSLLCLLCISAIAGSIWYTMIRKVALKNPIVKFEPVRQIKKQAPKQELQLRDFAAIWNPRLYSPVIKPAIIKKQIKLPVKLYMIISDGENSSATFIDAQNYEYTVALNENFKGVKFLRVIDEFTIEVEYKDCKFKLSPKMGR